MERLVKPDRERGSYAGARTVCAIVESLLSNRGCLSALGRSLIPLLRNNGCLLGRPEALSR